MVESEERIQHGNILYEHITVRDNDKKNQKSELY